MMHTHSRLARGLLTGTAIAMLAGFALTPAGATEIHTSGQQIIVNDQRVPSPTIHAGTGGSSGSIAAGDTVSGSTLAISGNSQRANATSNAAQQSMPIERTSIYAATGDSYDANGNPYTPVTTFVGGVGITSNGAFDVVNNQSAGRGEIVAVGHGTASAIGISGDAWQSALKIDGNSTVATAIGNDGSSAISLKATAIGAAAGVNNVQSSKGGIASRVGSSTDKAGATVSVSGQTGDGSIAITGNSAGAASLANRAVNSVGFEATSLMSARPFVAATAGRLSSGGANGMSGVGADGDAALSNVQRVDLRNMDDQRAAALTASVTGRYGVDAAASTVGNSSITLDGNSQSAETFGNAVSNTLAVKAVKMGGDYYMPAPSSALSSVQTGQGDLTAASRMTVDTPTAIGQSSVTLSNNGNSALARMNDAGSSLTVDGVTIGGNAFGTVSNNGATVMGDHVLANNQTAGGSVKAVAISQIGGGDGSAPIQSSRYAVKGNATGSEATANRALNSLSVSAASALNAGTALSNRQTNGADATAVTKAVLAVTAGGALQSSLTVDGNSATSLGRGNVAENRMTLSGGQGSSGDGGGNTPALMARSASSSSMPGNGILANRQVNTGAIKAVTTGAGSAVALNCGCTDGSLVGVSTNRTTASAYGNAVLNAATVEGGGQPQIAMVGNVQVNTGPVTARVVTAIPAIMTSGVSGSTLSVTGNAIAATAIGNQAVNAISASR